MDLDRWHRKISELALEDEDEAVAACLELSRRLGGSPDPRVRGQVVDALVACAQELTGRGCEQSALSVVQEIRSRFAGDPVARIQMLVAGSLTLAADLQVRAGELQAALVSYDVGLSLVAGSEELERRGVDATLLLEKGRVLSSHDRREEAIIVLDSALDAIARASARKPALRTRQAALAVAYKLDQLCALDRFAEASTLMQQLADVLSQISPNDPRNAPAPAPSEASEATLAAAFAEIVNDGECWAVFAGSLDISAAEAARRACRLYGISEPWILSAASEPVEVAAALVRVIADGYALLSGQWSPAQRASLPFPDRAGLERHELLRRPGVGEWAQGHGYPLNLAVQETGAAETQIPAGARVGPSGGRAVSPSLRRDIIKCLYLYELADLLSQSRHGWEALRYKRFAALAIEYVKFAMNWGRAANAEGTSDGRLAVAVACQQIAEGFFAITHCQHSADGLLSPGKGRLREVLHQTGGYDWLKRLDVTLPTWTHATGM